MCNSTYFFHNYRIYSHISRKNLCKIWPIFFNSSYLRDIKDIVLKDPNLQYQHFEALKFQRQKYMIYSKTRVQRIARNRPFLFVTTGVHYNWVYLCTKMTNLTPNSVRYNWVLVNNRVCYNRVLLQLYNSDLWVAKSYIILFLWVANYHTLRPTALNGGY